MITIETMTQELHKAFRLLNKRFYENKLPTPAITIQSSTNHRLSMGWCTEKEVWRDREGTTKMYEINISAEHINLDFFETMDTLMHEMVHLYNLVHKIQDCSRKNTYHNKHFKERAIQSGFYYEDNKPNPKYGWSFAKLTEETKTIIANMDLNKEAFKLGRKSTEFLEEEELSETKEEKEKKKGSIKWFCPSCGVIVRSTKKDIYIKCGDCQQRFVEEE